MASDGLGTCVRCGFADVRAGRRRVAQLPAIADVAVASYAALHGRILRVAGGCRPASAQAGAPERSPREPTKARVDERPAAAHRAVRAARACLGGVGQQQQRRRFAGGRRGRAPGGRQLGANGAEQGCGARGLRPRVAVRAQRAPGVTARGSLPASRRAEARHATQAARPAAQASGRVGGADGLVWPGGAEVAGGPRRAPGLPLADRGALRAASRWRRRISPNAPAQQVQRRVLPPANAGLDVVLRSSTGSGKTLAFLLPALASACPRLCCSH